MKYSILIVTLIALLIMQSFTLYYNSQIRSDMFVRTIAYDSAIGMFEHCVNRRKKH